MKKLSMAVIVLAAAAPAFAQQAKPTPDVHGINPADMNTAVQACQDFNQYANGGWMKANPIPSDQSEWGSFSVLEEQNRESLHKVLEKVSKASKAPGSDDQKVGDFYLTCMDEAAIEAQGTKPLQGELDAIDKVASAPDLEAEIARLQLSGVNAVFNFGSDQDRKNSSEVIAGAYQGGLGLPDRDYYTKTDDESKKLRDEYVVHVTKMLTLLGEPPARAAEDAKAIMALETKLAEASMTRVERRNPDNTYHRKTLEEVAKLTPNFSWSGFLKDLNAPTVVAINVAQPGYFEEVNRELAGTPLPAWKAYLRWHLVHSAAPSLSKAFVDENFNFYGKTLRGTPENEVRWKRCVSATDDALGFALGKAWVRDYFPPEAKARADAMVKNLVAALRADLTTLSWMGEATRKEALAKLDAFDQKIGYPEKWRDYSKLTIDRGAYVLNVQRANDFEYRRDLAKIGKPVDRAEWGMSPPTVNAYYSAQKNEIVFPAGILQPPFFDAQADDAVNYGAIGAVIGHEMTHGFDDQGRKFDAKGNQRDWWTPEDLKNYQQRSKCVEDQYASYVYEGQHTNAKLVLGEATADLGGLGIAYRAYHISREGKPPAAKIDGLTDDQRLFLGWAHVWAANIRPEFAKLMLNTNPHPLPQFRADGPPSTLPEFAKAFGCKAGDPMVRQDLCQIW
ncbi:MAG TPA: M13 family metallopeptidase [Thermoanaerobaculia bacterium]|nr:M13 family metallopeptidase [Thermoanaerobaculia bacterium]